jgi:alkylhydroperoxidase family enzyme
MIAKHMIKADAAIVDRLRKRQTLSDHKLEALAAFTRAVVKNRGMVCGSALDQFLTAGYTNAQVLEVVLGVAMKTLSNYTHHIIDVPLDAAFQAEVWNTNDQCDNKQCA